MSSKWYKKKDRNTYLMETYGITHTQYLTMYREQNAKCAICNTKPDAWPGLVVDHCHTTGKVRGLLCNKCNLGLGWFKDNPSSLNRAITYLQKQ